MFHRTGRRPFHHIGRASRGCEKKYGPVALVHFDSHSDLCDEVFARNITMARRSAGLLKKNLIDASHSIQVGNARLPCMTLDEHKMAAELGMKLIPAHKVREMGLETLIKTILERVGISPAS